jgi:hypothetical protein
MNIPTYQELYNLAYIRGSWTCPKCGFVLSKKSISVETGEMGTTETDRQSETCPNDGEFLLPSTYKDWLQSTDKVIDDLMRMRQRLRDLIQKTKDQEEGEGIQFFAGILLADDVQRIIDGQLLDGEEEVLCHVCHKPINETGSAIPVEGEWKPVHIGCYHSYMDGLSPDGK